VGSGRIRIHQAASIHGGKQGVIILMVDFQFHAIISS
jgi:hypothetical protein